MEGELEEMDMAGTHRGDATRGGTRNQPTERPSPPRALLAGEEDGGDEPHIQRGID
ncbi:hypothetical protein [Streptomyces camelliae]|uniref:Uncharacterized protein n=1 Tax=Streptomyces camelliae TaxID=3004093 RepID=A0ABY7P9P1_9ACTN|nr:hypothetical protein [Streptomyces sp. HUAS 2-6]WBO66280.1 hypothetical protein O1G22_27455 [Streptomyces sp. HUAS 2-6]